MRLMPENNEQQVIEQYKQRRTRQIAITVPGLLAILLLFWSTENPETTFAGLQPSVITGIAIALLVATVVLSFLNWRCPACGKYLGRAFNPKFCSGCGAHLH
jgi:hypothetical protein